MGDFRKLKVWEKAQDIVTDVYRVTATFPASERYSLSTQMRRSAVSVSANLAEGCGRMGDIELRRFVRISLGSLSELECELLIASNLQFVTREKGRELISNIGLLRGMLQRLHHSLAPESKADRSRASIDLDSRP